MHRLRRCRLRTAATLRRSSEPPKIAEVFSLGGRSRPARGRHRPQWVHHAYTEAPLEVHLRPYGLPKAMRLACVEKQFPGPTSNGRWEMSEHFHLTAKGIHFFAVSFSARLRGRERRGPHGQLRRAPARRLAAQGLAAQAGVGGRRIGRLRRRPCGEPWALIEAPRAATARNSPARRGGRRRGSRPQAEGRRGVQSGGTVSSSSGRRGACRASSSRSWARARRARPARGGSERGGSSSWPARMQRAGAGRRPLRPVHAPVVNRNAMRMGFL